MGLLFILFFKKENMRLVTHRMLMRGFHEPMVIPPSLDSPGKNTGMGCHFLLQCMKVKMKVKSLSPVQLVATPWTAAYQAPPSMGFSRQEYWSGVPLPSPNISYLVTC